MFLIIFILYILELKLIILNLYICITVDFFISFFLEMFVLGYKLQEKSIGGITSRHLKKKIIDIKRKKNENLSLTHKI